MAVITGTTGDDNNLVGTIDADTINALDGNDRIIGFVGADIVNGGTGNDTIVLTATSTDLNTAINSQIVGVEAVDGSGASGDITINLGLQTEGFIITGGADNDTITGGAGADNINAGDGNDTINGFVGTDTVNGGNDTDTLALTVTSTTLNSATDLQLVNVEKVTAAGAAAGITLNLVNQSDGLEIIGSGFADAITGSSGGDKINAGGGNDTINGFTTGDEVDGGGGSDSIVLTTFVAVAALNAANDGDIDGIEAVTAAAVGAPVTIDLSDQSEGFSITGTSFADNLIGGGGNDTFVGFVGADILDGNGGGNDTIALTATSTALNTALNTAIVDVEAVSAANAASGVTINLSLQTEGFKITGGSGNDTITGTGNDDEIFGGGGNDTINGFTTDDKVDGGAGGNDRIVLTATSTGLNNANDDDIEAIEGVTAASAAAGVTIDLHHQSEGFTITGSAFADNITGGEGSDTILAGSGNDTINGFEGADTVDGATGTDTIVLSQTSSDLNAATNSQILGVEVVTAASAGGGVTINLGLQSESFSIIGSEDNDTITGSAGIDTINAGAGNDTINGFVSADTVNGGADTDTLRLTATSTTLNVAADAQLVNVEEVDASDAAAGIIVNLSNQSEGFEITGGDFADTITGTANVDTIKAGGGNDTINGFTTGDQVDGEGGSDSIALTTLAAVAALNAADNDDIDSVEAVSAVRVGAAVTIDLSDQSEGFSITGTSSADTLIGGGGNDTFVGFGGADTVDGNGGNDTIALTATSSALNAAGNAAIVDVEVVSAANATSSVAINLINQAEGFTIIGSSGSDTITGTAAADTIAAGGGNDTINGFTSGDEVDGGAGVNDKIVLTTLAHIAAVNAAGNDAIVNVEAVTAAAVGSAVTIDLSEQTEGFSITTTAFADTITGGNGNDTILAGGGNDTINGFVGADTVDGGSNIDTILLTETSATLNAASNAQIVNLEAVNAAGASSGITINLGMQSEGFIITGGSNNDTITGGAGVDNIAAGGGNDTINGFVGADTVNGGAGSADTLALTATSTTLNSATDAQLVGVERVDASGAAAGVAFSLANQTEGFTIIGSAFNDTITGSAAADTIAAGNGNDTINGFTTGDSVNGEGGTDTIALTTQAAANALNAASDDSVQEIENVSAAAAGVGITINLQNQTEGFSITGSKSADTLTGGGAADTFVGYLGADILDGNGGTDTLMLTATSKTLSTATNLAIADIEAISAASALKAVTINVALQTEGFTITGSNFGDTITGSAGADIISGGAGNDKVNGGAGGDTFEFNAGDGQDTITGFVAGVATDDVIDLTSFAFADVSEVFALATDNGTDTVIDFGGGNRLTLLGVTEAQLHADDFLLS